MANRPRLVYRKMFECARPKWGFVFDGSQFWGYDSLPEAMHVLIYLMRPKGLSNIRIVRNFLARNSHGK